jgi:hypothetical protein
MPLVFGKPCATIPQDLHTSASPTFAGLSLGTGELTTGSINRSSGSFTLEIGGTAEQTITSTETTFGGNLVVPDDSYIGSASAPDAIQIESDGSVIVSQNITGNMIITNSSDYDYQMPSDENLVAYLSFDDGSGTLAVDNSGNGNNATVSGTWTAGISGKGINFDSFYDCALLSTPIGTDATYTVSLWYKRSNDGATNYRSLIADASANIHHLLINNPGTTTLCIFDGSLHDFSGYSIPDDGKYHNYIVVYVSQSTADLYVDGEYISQVSHSINLNTYKFGRIGNWTDGSYWAGPMDEVRIYEGALTASEIKALYLNPSGNQSAKISSKQITGNLIIPDAGYIGSTSDTDAIQIEADGDVILTKNLGIGTSSPETPLAGTSGMGIYHSSSPGIGLQNSSAYWTNYMSGTTLIWYAAANKMTLSNVGDLWVAGNVSADSFTDRTPFYEGDALSELSKIQGISGEIDHVSLPNFMRKVKINKNSQGKLIIEYGRDIGATVSMLIRAVQQLNELNKIKNKLN